MYVRTLIPKIYSPFQFLQRYHQLSFTDHKLGLNGEANLSRYIAGWKPDNNTEYWQVLAGLANLLGHRHVDAIPSIFTIPNDARVPADRTFLKGSLRRAFGGRGSPDDFRDAIHIAYLVKRIKFASEANTYAEKWFGNDCNAFVGNFQGISPSTAIFAYALGYGKSKSLLGATPDVYVTRDLLPLPPIARVDQISEGTVMIVYGTPSKRTGSKWRHIAVVETFVKTGPTSGILSTAGWGTGGGYDDHVSRDKKVELHLNDTCPEMHGKKLIALHFTYEQQPAQYIFFDASPLEHLYSRGLHVGNRYGT